MGPESSLTGWFANPGFMPHIHCYLGEPRLVWSMVLTDLLIGLSYLFISLTLFTMARRLQVRFSPIVLCFGAFIAACGATHFMEVWTLWHPDYWWSAGIKAVTAFASIGTGAYLVTLRQPIAQVAADARASEERRLQLETLTKELEERVASRTRELEDARNHLQSAIDAVPALISHIDAQGRYRLVNAAYEQWFGVARDQILGRTMSDVLGPAAWSTLKEPFERAIAGNVVSFEREVPYRDGGHRYVRVSYTPDRPIGGGARGVFSLVTDLSELRQHQEAERQTRAQLEAAFQAMTDGVMVFDTKGLPVFINEAEARLVGYATTEEMRRSPSTFSEAFELRTLENELIPLSDWPAVRILQGQTLPPTEVRARRSDTGQEWFFQLTGQPVRDHTGKQILGILITRDITQLKKAEAALRASEEQFRTMANTLPQLAWMAGEDGALLWYNQRWYDYTGTTPQAMKGWGWQQVHHPDHLERVTERYKQRLASGEVWEDTFPLRRHDGEWRWFLSRAAPIRDLDGRIIRWFGSNTDVTEQLRSQNELKEAVRARDEFLSVASHELKTPLTSLVLQNQMFLRGVRRGDQRFLEPERVTRLLELVDKQTARLSRLVEDMLDITRIQTGQLALRPAPVSLGEVVEEVIERVRPSMLDAGTPPTFTCAATAMGQWDRFRLEQVVSNLLTNAQRYGDHRPIDIRVDVHEGRARLAVKDQGIGLRSEDVARIFQRFERAVSAHEVSGLGLGLFIATQIVEAHKGRLWVESEGLGKGATFFVELPMVDVKSESQSEEVPLVVKRA